MNKWTRTTLGHIVSSGGGKIQTGPFGSQLHASDYVTSGIPCIMPANMRSNRVDLSDIAFISTQDAERLSQHIVRKGDVVYSRRGDVTQKALIREEEAGYFCGTGCLLVRPGKGIDSAFLTYQLSTPSSQKWIVKQAVGATMPNLNTSILSEFPLSVPERSVQEKISSVLSALDDKIACNNRINAQFETLAKTLYDYWFVQFDFPNVNRKPYKSAGGKMVYNPILKRDIPDGWTNGTLNDLGQIVGGSTPSTQDTENFTTSGTPWITPYDLSNNQGNKFITRGAQDVSNAGIKNASLKKYPSGTVLLSSRAPIGYLAIARNELTTNQGFKSFIPNNGYSTAFIYYTVKRSLKAIIQYASGSTFQEISASVLKTVKIVLPESDIVDQFTRAVIPIFQHQDLLEQENQHLTRLRDWLLPMLMNGQVSGIRGLQHDVVTAS
jgi:type I restriction enzyme S subunit